MKRKVFALMGLVLTPLLGAAADRPSKPYLGQEPPVGEARLFAPGIVSTALAERDVAITPDGRELYFSVMGPGGAFSTILCMREVDGRWSAPEVAAFSGDPTVMDLEPALSPDGSRFFFLSNRPRTGKGPDDRNEDIWVMDRQGDGWGAPYNLGPPVNSDDSEFFPSVTRDGTLYFTRSTKGKDDDVIYRSRLVNGRYAAPERLPDTVNSGTARFNAMIAPDESFLVLNVMGRDDAIGRTDYYVAFRSPGDAWSPARNLGALINPPGSVGYSSALSPDGKYFFFASTRPDPSLAASGRLTHMRLLDWVRGPQNGNLDIYWVATQAIEALRPPASTGP